MTPRSLAIMILAAGVWSGCASRAPIAHASAPEPTGCFVEVFEKEDFTGPRDFINGPAKHWHLRELPFRANWHRRIRSLRVGPAATVLLWAKEGFEGDPLKFGPDRNHPRLPPGFGGTIASLQIECSRAPAD
jgi:hypothetical protein